MMYEDIAWHIYNRAVHKRNIHQRQPGCKANEAAAWWRWCLREERTDTACSMGLCQIVCGLPFNIGAISKVANVNSLPATATDVVPANLQP